MDELKKEIEALKKENQRLKDELEYRNKRFPSTIRVKNLAQTLDHIQHVFQELGGEKRKGAEAALNAVRRSYGIPADGEQIELFVKK